MAAPFQPPRRAPTPAPAAAPPPAPMAVRLPAVSQPATTRRRARVASVLVRLCMGDPLPHEPGTRRRGSNWRERPPRTTPGDMTRAIRVHERGGPEAMRLEEV